MTREFVALPSFLSGWKALGLDEPDLRRLELELLDDPKAGSVMVGTGRARKVRFAFAHRGKSGSVRVIYVDFERYEKLYFVAVYQKAEKENLTEAERRRVRGLIDELEHILERGWHRGAF